MSSRPPYLIAAFHSFLAGAIVAAVFSSAWYVTTGGLPSVWVAVVVTDTAIAVWSIVQTARLRRKWQTVLDAYGRPALGDGIDTPNRPPADEDGAS